MESKIELISPPSEEDLASLYLDMKQCGTLAKVFPEGVPSLRWWLDLPRNVLAATAARADGHCIAVGWVNSLAQGGGHVRAEVSIASASAAIWLKLKAARAMLEKFVEQYRPRVIYATIPQLHEAAVAFAKRLGFKPAARIPLYTVWDGQPIDAALLYLDNPKELSDAKPERALVA